jgi:hypothetical protein
MSGDLKCPGGAALKDLVSIDPHRITLGMILQKFSKRERHLGMTRVEWATVGVEGHPVHAPLLS